MNDKGWVIRAARKADAAAMADVFARSVSALAGRAYAPDQVEAWLGRGLSARKLAEKSGDGRTCLVAEIMGAIVGFIDLEADGHIDHLFCAPEAAGKGVAAALYTELEREAHRRGVRRLHTEASELARSFFLKQGFVLEARRDFRLEGVVIHNYAMAKVLAAGQSTT